MLNKDSTYKDALRYVNEGKYCIFDFFSDGMLDEICEEELFEMLQNHSISIKSANKAFPFQGRLY